MGYFCFATIRLIGQIKSCLSLKKIDSAVGTHDSCVRHYSNDVRSHFKVTIVEFGLQRPEANIVCHSIAVGFKPTVKKILPCNASERRETIIFVV